ncbi:MAG: hypothetical protein DRO67_08575 [Candidatus Asgardarchaeum californiense]|nr:MAG: hypothetical protein DRO67_08575 [Candidatus Asgardarchaeum californiense]
MPKMSGDEESLPIVVIDANVIANYFKPIGQYVTWFDNESNNYFFVTSIYTIYEVLNAIASYRKNCLKKSSEGFSE